MASALRFLGSAVRGVVDDEIDERFAQLPALLLDGQNGVGKTATATQRCRSVRRLDAASGREIVAAGRQLDGDIDRIVDHDLPEAGFDVRL